MPIYAKRKEYELPPQGLHDAVCCDVVDLGIVESEKWGPQVKVKVVWQLREENKQGRRFLASKRFTPSLGKKANLRKDLESWRGRPFTSEEQKLFDIEKLLGANCQLSITHNASDDGGAYANVVSVVPASKMAPKLYVENYEREKDREGYVPPTQPEPDEPEEEFTPGDIDEEEPPF